MITSPQNPRIKQVRALQGRSRERRRAHAFVIEGVRLLEEALQTAWPMRFLLHTADLDGRAQAVVESARQRGVDVVLVSLEVMRAASDTETPQGVLAVAERMPLDAPESPDFVLLPDGVRDPGNLGTLLRTALAAGADAVLLPPGNVDPFAPKVLRAGMGAHFHLPVLSLSWDEIARRVQDWRLSMCLADAAGAHLYTEVDFTQPTGIIIGGEAGGAGTQARALASCTVRIPMPGAIESLNAAIAASVVMFEVVRQRAANPPSP